VHPDITAAISKIKVDSDKHIQDVVKTCYEAVVEYSPRPGHSKKIVQREVLSRATELALIWGL